MGESSIEIGTCKSDWAGLPPLLGEPSSFLCLSYSSFTKSLHIIRLVLIRRVQIYCIKSIEPVLAICHNVPLSLTFLTMTDQFPAVTMSTH
jgi:hypothetical protein